MRHLALLALIAAAPAMAAAAKPGNGEAQLARAIEGRVAEAPVDCISLPRIRSVRVIDGTALVYDAGGTVYVNRPRAGAESLDRWDTIVNRPFGTRLCSTDTLQMIEPGSHMLSGLVFLGEFVPYRRAR